MNREPGVENAPCATTGAATGSRPRRAAGCAPKHRPWSPGARAMGTRALWCTALLLALCAPAMAIETLSVGFGMNTEADGRALESADDAAPADGRMLAELPPYTSPTLPIGEQLFLVLSLATASGDVSPFTLNMREPTGARRPVSREDPLVLTGGETMPMVELWIRGNATARDQSVTVSIAEARVTKGIQSHFDYFSFEERTIPMPRTCPHEPGGKVVSEEKIALIEKINERLCQLARSNDFYGIQRTLKGMGNHYFGEPITVLEAYPYIRCPSPIADNLDLLRVAMRNTGSLKLFTNDIVVYFSQREPCNYIFLNKLVACRQDIGYGCMNVFESLDRRRRLLSQTQIEGISDTENFAEETYGRFLQYLKKKVNQMGGPTRDLHFCAIMNEPAHCLDRG